MTRRPTLADVAKRSGMSVTAVSLVLNDRPGSRLSDETKARIRTAAQELEYRPNPAARSLRLGKTRTIGFVSDDVTITRYGSAMIRGALTEADAHDYTVLMAETAGHPKRIERAIKAMLDRRPDGLIIALTASKLIDVPDAAAGVPLVILNGESAGHACVLRDERTAGRLVVRYLIERGHRRIAVIGDSVALRTNRRLSASVGDRFEGLEAGLAEDGLEFVARYHEDEWEPERGFAAMLRLLDDDPGATAVVALNDRLAFGGYQALSERGLRVPDSLSMVSFDDDVIASYVSPGLTTMRLPYEEMGREAMRMLLSGRPSGTLHVPLQLQERGSVRTVCG